MPKKKERASAAVDSQKVRRHRVVLVDDHPLVREGLAALIRATPDLVVAGEVGSAAETFDLLATEIPDLILLDLALPGVSGIDFLKELRARSLQVRVLVLSMHEESVYAERVLRAGAQGYIMKHEPGDKIIEAIRCVQRGELYVSPAIATRMVKIFVGGRQGGGTRNSVEQLSDRELQVFTYIGNGISTQEVAGLLNLSVKTIQTYREHIKRKLSLRNATDLVHHATQWVEAENGRVTLP
jgi:DNA-binding NarL/FixJ family response regulator